MTPPGYRFAPFAELAQQVPAGTCFCSDYARVLFATKIQSAVPKLIFLQGFYMWVALSRVHYKLISAFGASM